jgi:hypothetical protein
MHGFDAAAGVRDRSCRLAFRERLRLLGFFFGQQLQELPALRLVRRVGQTVAEVLEIAFVDELFHRVAPLAAPLIVEPYSRSGGSPFVRLPIGRWRWRREELGDSGRPYAAGCRYPCHEIRRFQANGYAKLTF